MYYTYNQFYLLLILHFPYESFKGAAQGFVYEGQFLDKTTDMHGFYGLIEEQVHGTILGTTYRHIP